MNYVKKGFLICPLADPRQFVFYDTMSMANDPDRIMEEEEEQSVVIIEKTANVVSVSKAQLLIEGNTPNELQ